MTSRRPPHPLPPPPPTPAVETPLAVAERFAAAWEAGDAAGMYALLDSGTRAALPLADFAAAYEGFRQEAAVTAIAVSVGEDGQRITFRVRLETHNFGALEYATLVPFVALQSGSPGIAWTPALLHPALAGGGELRGRVLRPTRGAIYDRNGEPLAITLDVRMIGLDRSRVFDREAVTAAFVSFGFEEEDVAAAFESTLGPRQRVPLGVVPDSRVEEAARFVEAVPGAVLWFDERRVHPLGPAAAHVVGYTREYTAEELEARPDSLLRPGDRLGAVGIEAALDAVLAGRTGARLEVMGGEQPVVLFEREFIPARTCIPPSTPPCSAPPTKGSRGWQAQPSSSTRAPTPSSRSTARPPSTPTPSSSATRRTLAELTTSEEDPLNDRATQGLYSAGSTFKLVTGAAGLAEGLYAPGDRLFCGAIWYGVDPPRRNWEGERGLLTIAEGLMRSCNPVFTK